MWLKKKKPKNTFVHKTCLNLASIFGHTTLNWGEKYFNYETSLLKQKLSLKAQLLFLL